MSDVLAAILSSEMNGTNSMNHEKYYPTYDSSPIPAGEVVRVLGDGSISQRALNTYLKNSTTTALPFSDPPTYMESSGLTYGVDLGSYRYLCMGAGTGSGKTLFIVDTTSNTPQMVSTPVVFTATASAALRFVKFSNTSLLMITYTGGAPYATTAYAISISGNTITVSAGTSLATIKQTSPYYNDLQMISAGKALWTYIDGTNNTPKAQVITVSGTSLSTGTSLQINGGAGDWYLRTTSTGTDKAVVAYQIPSSGMSMIPLTVSGTTITLGTSRTPTTPISTSVLFTIISTANDLFYVLWHPSGNGLLYAESYTVSGVNIVNGTVTTSINLAGVSMQGASFTFLQLVYTSATAKYYGTTITNGNDPRYIIFKLNNDGSLATNTISTPTSNYSGGTAYFANNKIWSVAQMNSGPNKSTLGLATWTPDTTTVTVNVVPTSSAPYTVIDPSYNYHYSNGFFALPNGGICLLSNYTGQTGKYITIEPNDAIAASAMAANDRDVALGVKSANGNVILKGVAGGFSGLSVGQKYYADTSGWTLDLTPVNTSNVVVGVAISPTEILMTDYFSTIK